MRVTFILPEIGLYGGVRATLELANHLQMRGHRVSVVHPLIPIRNGYQWYNPRKLARRTLKTVRNSLKPNRVDWLDMEAQLLRTPTLNARYIPDGDVVIATWWANAFDVLEYPESKGRKFHLIRHYETWGGPKELVEESYRLPIEKIAISNLLIRRIEGQFKVNVRGPLLDGMNPGEFYMDGGFEAGSPRRIGFLYRTARLKGCRYGLEALRIVKRRHSDVDCVLWGQRPSGEDSRIVEDLAPAQYHVMPHGEELRSIYASLDIFMYTSLFEGFGLPPMEAMACGAACVTTPTGAVPDYTIDGETALHIPFGRPEKVAQVLESLLLDEKRRMSIARRGHEHVQQFTWENTAIQLERMLRDALCESGSLH